MGEAQTRISRMLDSSEMACSLRFEDIKGCPYHAFSPKDIALFSIASSVLAVLSLIISI